MVRRTATPAGTSELAHGTAEVLRRVLVQSLVHRGGVSGSDGGPQHPGYEAEKDLGNQSFL